MNEHPGQRLAGYSAGRFERGRPAIVEAMWLLAQWLLVSSWLPGSRHRRLVLRMFGARIGTGVVIKPGVRVKFPWRLSIGDHSWIGERVWIDNLATVRIGADCCLSQGAYLCTGSHDWLQPTFDLVARSIVIGDAAWLAARSVVGPGVAVGEGAVLTLGSTATRDLLPWQIHTGLPAVPVAARRLRDAVRPEPADFSPPRDG